MKKMQHKKLLIGILVSALLVGIASAAVIASWSVISEAKYSVMKTDTTWPAISTVDLGSFYGKETKSGSEEVSVSTTTYAQVNFYFAVSTDSNLAGLQSWSVKVHYFDGNSYVSIDTLTSVYPAYIGKALSGKLTYWFKFEYSATAKDYALGADFTAGTIIVSCETQTP
jgi:hypothetical protein